MKPACSRFQFWIQPATGTAALSCPPQADCGHCVRQATAFVAAARNSNACYHRTNDCSHAAAYRSSISAMLPQAGHACPSSALPAERGDCMPPMDSAAQTRRERMGQDTKKECSFQYCRDTLMRALASTSVCGGRLRNERGCTGSEGLTPTAQALMHSAPGTSDKLCNWIQHLCTKLSRGQDNGERLAATLTGDSLMWSNFLITLGAGKLRAACLRQYEWCNHPCSAQQQFEQ